MQKTTLEVAQFDFQTADGKVQVVFFPGVVQVITEQGSHQVANEWRDYKPCVTHCLRAIEQAKRQVLAAATPPVVPKKRRGK